MSDAIDKLIAKVSFPSAGEFFSVVFIPFERDEPSFMGGTAEKVLVQDRSYRDDIFQCLASDASRVVAKKLTGYQFKEPHIFYRPEWQFDDVSALLPALGLSDEAATSPIRATEDNQHEPR